MTNNGEYALEDNSIIHVVRRDGSTTPLEITKIRKVVNFAGTVLQAIG
ncbi:hypothetical protein [Brasilonema sp. UFV-L1]|nr:hypothetical protein [Brasilonema sp. UFV-L1]